MGNVRLPLVETDVASTGSPNVRADLVETDVLSSGSPAVRLDLVETDVLTAGVPQLRLDFVLVESLFPVPEELPVATAVFPALRGLTWDIKKNPEFKTAVRGVTSGKETRNAFMAYPWWNFELAYDWLPDYAGVGSGYAYTDLRTLEGFFLQMQGSYQAFLFHDPDDYHVVGGTIATADGVTLQWPFTRDFGGFLEPVGQVDLSTLATFASIAVNTTTEAINVPAHGLTTGQGPLFVSNTGGALPTGVAAATSYWAIRVDADHFQLASSKANALANTPINLTATGSGTDTLTKGVAVYDNGTLLGPAAYTLTLPNQLVFPSAPTSGHAITADFDFWFVCRFTEDTTDFRQFASKLWDLQKLDFRSVIQ